MTDQIKQKIDCVDGPLFVLKYRKSSVLLRFFLFTSPFWCTFWFTGPVFIPLVLIRLFLLATQLLFELRLYNDRIVQVRPWCLITVPLTNAGLINRHTRHRYSHLKIFFSRDRYTLRKWLSQFFLRDGIIYFDMSLAGSLDMKTFNRMTAYLSGREIEELEDWRLDRLVKTGSGPRILTKETIARDFPHPSDLSESVFERGANKILIMAIFFMGLPACLLWFIILWKGK